MAPVHDQQQQRDGRRGEREAEVAGEGVQREGTAHEFLADRAGENGVVRGVDHRVADARQHRQRQDQPEVGDEGHGADGERHDQRAADQEAPRAVLVDEKADGGLQHGRGGAHQRDGEAQHGEGDAELVAPHQEERCQAQHVEVREEMARPDEGANLRIALRRQDGFAHPVKLSGGP
jgi:hypothetical protein